MECPITGCDCLTCESACYLRARVASATDAEILTQVTEAMSNCRENGFYDETIKQTPEQLADDLIEKGGVNEGHQRDRVITACRTYKGLAQ